VDASAAPLALPLLLLVTLPLVPAAPPLVLVALPLASPLALPAAPLSPVLPDPLAAIVPLAATAPLLDSLRVAPPSSLPEAFPGLMGLGEHPAANSSEADRIGIARSIGLDTRVRARSFIGASIA
jgi:hypothetical protein